MSLRDLNSKYEEKALSKLSGAFFIGFICFVVSLIIGVPMVKDSLAGHQTEVLEGRFVERFKVNRNKQSPYFYLVYQYRNPYTDRSCRLDREAHITPRDKICALTLSRVKVDEATYKAISIPQDMQVLHYLSDRKTRSKAIGYGPQPQALRIGLIIFLSGFLFCIGYILRFFRA